MKTYVIIVGAGRIGIDDSSPAIGKTVAGLGLPAECVLIAVMRSEQVIFPHGDTSIRSGDQVFALARGESVSVLKRALLGDRDA